MKRNTISLRRRHLMIAGIAGAAVPGTVSAGLCGGATSVVPAATELFASEGESTLVVSGRILRADCQPLAGATIEVWHADAAADQASATTDADGRFFTTIAPPAHPGRPQPLYYRVSHQEHGTHVRQLYFASERGVPDDHLASHLQRDDTGVWRTTFGLTVA